MIQYVDLSVAMTALAVRIGQITAMTFAPAVVVAPGGGVPDSAPVEHRRLLSDERDTSSPARPPKARATGQ